MLVSVTFAYVDVALRENEFKEKKETSALYLLLPCARLLKMLFCGVEEESQQRGLRVQSMLDLGSDV